MSYKRLTEHGKQGWAKVKDGSAQGLVVAIERLAELEDKIENGTLIDFPCAIGSTIYLVPSETQFRLNNIGKSFKKHNRVYEIEVYQIYMNKNDYVLYNFEQTASALGSSFGETWFLTKVEAEKKLEELSKNP